MNSSAATLNMSNTSSTLPFILVPNSSSFPSPNDLDMSSRPRPSFPIPINHTRQQPPPSDHSMSISPENRLQQQLNQSNFQGPQHRHAHHLHSIPPKEKTTRTLILDHLLCLHARARFAQARAELGLDPERVASDDEEDDLSPSDSECMDWTASNGSIKDAMNARVYKARADGLEKVLSAMLEQPPEELPFDADDLLFRDTTFQLPSAPTLPNGVRLRLALAGLINDVFAEDELTVPKDATEAATHHFYHSPPPPLASYSPALSLLAKVSSFAQHTSDNQRPVLPSFQSFTATTDSGADAPPAQSIIPPPPAGSIFSSIPRGAGPESPWALGGSLGSRSSTSNGGPLASSSSSSSFPATSPGGMFPPPSRPTPRYGPATNTPGDMRPPPPPRVFRAVGRSRDLYNAGTIAHGASSSTSPNRPYRCPHHLTYTCPPSSFCVSSLAAQSPLKTSKSRTRSSIGAGLSSPGAPLRRAAYYGKNQGKEARMTDLLPRFLRLSALVAVELGREERHEDERAEEQQARMLLAAKRKEGRSLSSSSSVGGRARATSGAGDAMSSLSYDSDDDSPATAKRLAARPTKLWYKLLAGLLTRAVLQGYLVKGWKGTDPVEVLMGVGVGSVPPEETAAARDDEDVAMSDDEEEKDYEPDDMPDLADAWHILFGFKSKDAAAVSAPSPTTTGVAADDYENLMAERISEFFTISPNITDLSNHLDDLAHKYPSQPVDRSLLKFCEAVAKWRGKPELETYKDRPFDAPASPATGLSTSATSNLSIHQLIHPQPPPKPLIERYFVVPSKSEREATIAWAASSSSGSKATTAAGGRRDSVSSTGTKRSRRSSWVDGKGKKVVVGQAWMEDEEYVGPYGI